ncbi:threonine dehydrogenase-like Zn-dependent dehydrogenase [Bradyrhizobium sp. GM7.3]
MRWAITRRPERDVGMLCEKQQRVPIAGVLVTPRWCGICGTDLDIVRRARPDSPSVLGHEALVRVVEKSAGSYWNGSLSGWAAVNPVSANNQNDILGHSVPGIWSSSRVITSDEIEAGHLVEWCAAPDHPAAALVEPLATVVYADELVSRCISGASSVAVVGSGSFAALAALYFSCRGVQCTIAGSNNRRLEELGSTLNIPGLRLSHRRLLNVPSGFDAVFVAVHRSSSQAAIDFAFTHVRNGGVIDLVGAPEGRYRHLEDIRHSNVRGLPSAGVSRGIKSPHGMALLTGHRGTAERHFCTAMSLIQTDPEFWRRAITHIVPFQEAPDVIRALARERSARIHNIGVGKAVIDMVA